MVTDKTLVDIVIIPRDEGALAAMEAIPPLNTIINPLLNEISQGLSNMGKIVGGTNHTPKDANAGSVATLLSVYTKCERDITHPTLQLKQILNIRMKYLNDTLLHQVEQVKRLRIMIRTLKEVVHKTNSIYPALLSNANVLENRTGGILEVARRLVPTLTNAETKYKEGLHRSMLRCSGFDRDIVELTEGTANAWGIIAERGREYEQRNRGIGGSTGTGTRHRYHVGGTGLLSTLSPMTSPLLSPTSPSSSSMKMMKLDPSKERTCHELLKGQGYILERCKTIVNEVEEEAAKVAAATTSKQQGRS